MISAVEGILESRSSEYIIIKAGALSFNVFVSTNTLNELEDVGTRVYLHTHLYLREDNISLYGFASSDELKLFQKLITVAGIGPRLALSLLSTFTPEQLVSAIINNNLDLMCQASGVGKKIAARMVLELKGKLQKEGFGEHLPTVAKENAEVMAALINLGYSVREASEAVSILTGNKDIKLEDKIKMALQHLATK